MERFKIWCETKQKSKEVQEILFKLGYAWGGDTKKYIDKDAPIYICAYNNKHFFYGRGKTNFYNHEIKKEVTLKELKNKLKINWKERLEK